MRQFSLLILSLSLAWLIRCAYLVIFKKFPKFNVQSKQNCVRSGEIEEKSEILSVVVLQSWYFNSRFFTLSWWLFTILAGHLGWKTYTVQADSNCHWLENLNWNVVIGSKYRMFNTECNSLENHWKGKSLIEFTLRVLKHPVGREKRLLNPCHHRYS